MHLNEYRKRVIFNRSEDLAYRVFVRTLYKNGSTVYDVKLSRGDDRLMGMTRTFDNQVDAICMARDINDYLDLTV